MMNWLTRLFGIRSRIAPTERRRSTQLCVEELESRWVPSSVLHAAGSHAATSSNWSGYDVTANAGAVTSVRGSWTVPSVSGIGSSTSSAWVGIDGANSSSVEQIGTESDMTDGTPNYYAWYEMYPKASVTISSITINPGDTVSASVNYVKTSNGKATFTLTLTDGSKSYSTTQTIANPSRSSAEWVVEAPSYVNVLPLANFGAVTFTNAQATISGQSGPINNSSNAWSSAGASYSAINMDNPVSGALEATTSDLALSGTSFTTTFQPVVSTSTTFTATNMVAGPNGMTVTFVAEVTPASGSDAPTGSVYFVINNQAHLVPIQVVNGVAEAQFTYTLRYFKPTDVWVEYNATNAFQGSMSDIYQYTAY
jgi:hypothetical protein